MQHQVEAGERASLNMPGVLYIVATPIGNLDDISARALAVLRQVALVAVEDTRHSARLLRHYGISTPMLACHEFNEAQRVDALLARIDAGEDIALVSDAGTPLISDPGYPLVREARARGMRVVPVPGSCALIAALSVAGLPTDRFVFEGFLPAKRAARLKTLQELAPETRTLVFYEAPHRILESLKDLCECFGAEREITVARELTKTFETLLHGTLAEVLARMESDPNQQKGEFVLVLAGAAAKEAELDEQTLHTLRILLAELPLKQAASLAAAITGCRKNLLYEHALHRDTEKD